tara:strand:+ start:377 stop:514 length:138 start_codon:yes stop_codon:yes gene_type:complete
MSKDYQNYYTSMAIRRKGSIEDYPFVLDCKIIPAKIISRIKETCP